jgi:hypothetical protein
VNESGVGGIAVVVPMARPRVDGFEGNNDRIYDEDVDLLSGKTYCP